MTIKTLLFAVGALAIAACSRPTEPVTVDAEAKKLEGVLVPPPEFPNREFPFPGPAPQIQRAFALTPFAGRIEWTPVAGAAGYEVYRRVQSGPWMKVTAQPILGYACIVNLNEDPNNKCFTDSPPMPSLAPGLLVSYQVAAKYADMRDGLSDIVFVQTPLVSPSNFTARELGVGSGTIELSWDPIRYAKKYQVWFVGPTDGVTPFVPGQGFATTSITTTVQGLLPGTYNFWLFTSYDVAGYGEWVVSGPKATATVSVCTSGC